MDYMNGEYESETVPVHSPDKCSDWNFGDFVKYLKDCRYGIETEERYIKYFLAKIIKIY